MDKDNFDEEFFKKYVTYQNENGDDAAKHCTTEQELLETIDHFIRLREELRDEELDRLRQEAEEHLKALRNIHFARIDEEIRCFKEILALHKMLVKDDKSSN